MLRATVNTLQQICDHIMQAVMNLFFFQIGGEPN